MDLGLVETKWETKQMTEIPSLTCCSISNEPEQRLESYFQGPMQGLPSAGRCRTASHRKILKSSRIHWRGRDYRRVPKLKVRYGKSKGSEWFEEVHEGGIVTTSR